MVNVTNGKIIRLLVDDEPFDVRFGELRTTNGCWIFEPACTTPVDWISPAGKQVQVSSLRLVSFVQRAVAAVLYEVEPIEAPARLVVQSELVANEPMPSHELDPRAAAVIGAALQPEQHSDHDVEWCWCTARWQAGFG